MKEEKNIKVRLGTVICLVIIILLLLAMYFMYYYGIADKNKKISSLEKEKMTLQSKKSLVETATDKKQKMLKK